MRTRNGHQFACAAMSPEPLSVLSPSSAIRSERKTWVPPETRMTCGQVRPPASRSSLRPAEVSRSIVNVPKPDAESNSELMFHNEL